MLIISIAETEHLVLYRARKDLAAICAFGNTINCLYPTYFYTYAYEHIILHYNWLISKVVKSLKENVFKKFNLIPSLIVLKSNGGFFEQQEGPHNMLLQKLILSQKKAAWNIQSHNESYWLIVNT